MNHYFAYGLTISSDLVLPEFLPAQEGNDVVIQVDSTTDPTTAISLQLEPQKYWHLTVSRTQAVAHLRDAGIFRIEDGKAITINPLPTVDEGLLRAYIGGVMMAILLYQRGLLILHASAVQVANQVVAFLGMSGAGKSSLAAALDAQGYSIITDDVLALRIHGQGIEAIPGFPQIKLPQTSATTLGHDLDTLVPLHQAEEKLGYRLGKAFPTRAMPLQGVYFLATGDSMAITPMPPQEALLELIPHSAPTRWKLPGDGIHLTHCAELVRQVPTFNLQRPRDLTQLADSARMVEHHVMASLCAEAV
jgi:hypothetical protein